MNYAVQCSRKLIDGYDDLIKLNYREINPYCTRMTRFTFNLRSASFELVEIPWSNNGQMDLKMISPELLQENARVVKVRCVGPTVEFCEYAYCLPTFHGLYFYERDRDLIVELEHYVRIICYKAIVRVEEFSLDDYSIWTLG